MITKKALLAKLEEMNKSDVVVKYGDYRNSHPLADSPLQKAVAQLVDVEKIEARTYTNKRGVTHASPAWLVETYKKLVTLVCGHGLDINVRMVISVIEQ